MGFFGALGNFVGVATSPRNLDRRTPFDVNAAQRNAITGNIQNFDQASRLAAMTNEANQQQAIEMMRRAGVDIDDNAEIGRDLMAQSRGELPEQLIRYIRNQSASRSLSGGFGFTGASANLNTALTAREAIARSDAAKSSYSSWQRNTAALFAPAMMSAANMFVSPEFSIEQQARENELANQNDLLRQYYRIQRNMAFHRAGGQLGDATAGAAMGGFMGSGMGAGMTSGMGSGMGADTNDFYSQYQGGGGGGRFSWANFFGGLFGPTG